QPPPPPPPPALTLTVRVPVRAVASPSMDHVAVRVKPCVPTALAGTVNDLAPAPEVVRVSVHSCVPPRVATTVTSRPPSGKPFGPASWMLQSKAVLAVAPPPVQKLTE